MDLSTTASYRLLHKINKLFTIEKETVGKNYEEIFDIRQKKSKELVDDFFNDVKECAKLMVGKTKLHEAITYSINQESKLRRYLSDGRIEISNNRGENAIRPFCVGKKNWLFANTVRGAKTSAALYSLIETAKQNGLIPYKYLEYLLINISEVDLNDEMELEYYMPWSQKLPKELYTD